MARPTPVLPDVGSTIVPPGRSFPSRSASSIIARPMRSLTEPPGLRNSSFARISGRTSRPTRSSRTIGVSPTSSSTVGYRRAIARSVTAVGLSALVAGLSARLRATLLALVLLLLAGAQSAGAGRHGAYVVGDSLAYGTAPYLQRELPGWRLTLAVSIGLHTAQGAELVRARARSLPPV